MFGNARSFIETSKEKRKLKRSLSEEDYLKFIIQKMCRIREIGDDNDFYRNEMIDCYRYLRNRLADPNLSPGLVQTFINNAEDLAAHVDTLLANGFFSSEATVVVFRIAIQFLGNAVTRAETAKAYRDAIYRRGPGVSFWIEMLEHADEKIKLYGSMLVYNSLRDPSIRNDVIGCHELAETIFRQACPVSGEPNEWCLFSAQILLAMEEEYLEFIWQRLDFNCHLRILRVAQDALMEAHTNPSTPVIHERNAAYLGSVFVEESASCENRLKVHWPINHYEMETTAELLAFLCQITALEGRYQSVRDDQRILEAALALLKLSTKPQSDPNTELEKLAAQAQVQDENSSNDQPFVDFRSRLVRLLANCSYKHPSNQKFIGDRGGIALVMNSTPLDADNAFITEWSIFALRNLLEGCPDNQMFVKKLQPQGFADRHGSGTNAMESENDSSDDVCDSSLEGVD